MDFVKKKISAKYVKKWTKISRISHIATHESHILKDKTICFRDQINKVFSPHASINKLTKFILKRCKFI